MINIVALRKSYGKRIVLRGVTLQVSRGEAVALWGGNGAGKTTVLRCVLGLTRYEGGIFIDGIDATRQGACARGRIGYVPQELPAHGSWRALESLEFIAKLRGAARNNCQRLLARVGLASEARTRIEEFSGGMKQRLALAIALLDDPPILLLDEATAGLDLAGRRQLLDLLQEIRADGRTLLFTSHRPDEIEELADRAIALDQGVVVLDGPANELEALLSPNRAKHVDAIARIAHGVIQDGGCRNVAR